MKNILQTVVLILLIHVSSPAFSSTEDGSVKATEVQSFPTLPKGYTWVTFNGVSIPKPDTWFEHQRKGTYAASVESVKEQGIFETGVTIQVLRDVQETYNAPASVAVISLIRDIKNNTDNTLSMLKRQNVGDLKTFTLRYRNAPVSAVPIIVHKFIMANDKESFINIISFESTEKQWPEYWQNEGTTIFKRIILMPSADKT